MCDLLTYFDGSSFFRYKTVDLDHDHARLYIRVGLNFTLTFIVSHLFITFKIWKPTSKVGSGGETTSVTVDVGGPQVVSLGTPSFVCLLARKKSLDQLYSSIKHHMTTANSSDHMFSGNWCHQPFDDKDKDKATDELILLMLQMTPMTSFEKTHL